MGKKKPEEMAKLQEQFISGGSKLGYNAKDLAELFRQIEGFSGYGFNRSHAVCYSVITCHTAWLSANYPMEFFATLLTIDFGATDDVRRYVSAFKQRGFKIEAPNINTSDASFKIKDDSIIFGLSGVKGVGPTLSNKILKKRPKKGYQSLGDFIVRNTDLLNKKVVEQYAKAGAFSPFGVNKASALQSVDDILDFMDVQKNVADFYTIFNMCKIDLAGYFNECKVANINKPDALEYEIETLGLYITKHPMEDIVINAGKVMPLGKIKETASPDSKILTVGAICGIDIRKTKAKTNMATFNLTTATESIKCIVFPKKYAEFLDAIKEGKMVAIIGRVQEDEDEKQLSVDQIKTDISPYVCRVEAKIDEYKADRWISALTDEIYSDKLLGIIINQDLSYILER